MRLLNVNKYEEYTSRETKESVEQVFSDIWKTTKFSNYFGKIPKVNAKLDSLQCNTNTNMHRKKE